MKRVLSIIAGVLGIVVSASGLALKDVWPDAVTLLMFLGGMLAALAGVGMFFYFRSEKVEEDTQRILSDLDLLRLFEQQPGGLLSAEMIAGKSELTSMQANTRLKVLARGGLLQAGTNPSGMKLYYELPTQLEEIPGLTLSDSPFLTLEDLQQVFAAYDYKVSPHDLMVTTGLPWKVISREMQYFRKKGIVDVVYIKRPGDSPKQYVLLPPYNEPEKLDLASRQQINEEVRQVLYDEQFLV